MVVGSLISSYLSLHHKVRKQNENVHHILHLHLYKPLKRVFQGFDILYNLADQNLSVIDVVIKSNAS